MTRPSGVSPGEVPEAFGTFAATGPAAFSLTATVIEDPGTPRGTAWVDLLTALGLPDWVVDWSIVHEPHLVRGSE